LPGLENGEEGGRQEQKVKEAEAELGCTFKQQAGGGETDEDQDRRLEPPGTEV